MHTETEHTPGSLNDQRAGYPAYRAQLAAMSDRALSAGKSTVARQLSRKGGENGTPQTQAQ